MDLQIRLNDWKKKLLDLGKRNALINFKLDSKSIIRITKPSMSSIWEKIVEDDKEIKFPYVAESAESEEDVVLPEYEYGDVSVACRPKDAQRILKRLKKNYKSIAEEQDVNVLYLSFGMLEWTEKDSSKQPLYSPLILVPVTLECESIKAPIVLKATEDEIVINPSLSYKLNHDFGVTLPEFEDKEFPELLETLKTFAEKKGWQVKEEVCLSILSFLKINMYKDLERNKDRIMNHPVINAFAGNFDQNMADEIAAVSAEIAGFNHDEENPQHIFQVVDADSSQQDAILCAEKGISFVLQGPPGTGKSQTITNIIATKIAEGQKVLFVSEKKAALDVVYKRLKDAGLADFILTLHSNKANKKETLSQLENVFELSSKQININDTVRQQLNKLEKDRHSLNAYAEKINEVIPPLNKSIFYANGVISKYSDVEDITFDIPSVSSMTEDKLLEYTEHLTQFAKCLEEMNDKASENPWHDNVVPYMSNEFIHDFGEKKDCIIHAENEIQNLIEGMNEKLYVNIKNKNFTGLEKLKELLKKASESPCVPEKWLKEPSAETVEEKILLNTHIQTEYNTIMEKLSSVLDFLKNADYKWNFEDTDFKKSLQINDVIQKVRSIMEADLCYSAVYHDRTKLALIISTLDNIEEYNSISTKILDEYTPEIFNLDSKSMEMRYKYSYNSFLRIFKSGYRQDRKLLKQLKLNQKTKKRFLDDISLLENLQKRTELKEKIDSKNPEMQVLFPLVFKGVETDLSLINKEVEKFNNLFECEALCTRLCAMVSDMEDKQKDFELFYGKRYLGFDTDWNELLECCRWMKEFFEKCEDFTDEEISEKFVEKVCIDEAFKTEVTAFCENLGNLIEQYKEDFVWFTLLFENSAELLEQPVTEISERANECSQDMHNLELWIDYRELRANLKNIGLSDFIDVFENRHLKGNVAVPVFEKRFFRLWLDSVFPSYPEISGFRHTKHEALINEFSALDKKQFEIAQVRVRAEIINELPPFDSFTSGEVNILKHELSKQRKIMPIRKLFNKIPNLLLKLKPCLMMSPLSVSQFLESECYQFDTVIFDEASQVKTENAIGAIFRGKQVIIAGDSKQLPPTNFFEVTTQDNEFDRDDDEESELTDTSVLDEALFLPNKELLWHYRSRHEQLIAFSNSKIYKNKLVTFPSSTENEKDWGVEFIYVENGVYNSKGNSRGNAIEAQRVAREVFEHIKNHPERTLGVITFGIVQEYAIESAINKLRLEHPECESFFDEEKHEAFFVKSLENVQGDERDTIMFSIGYAKDKDGKMAMRFGPLSMIGGEKRLNVAITRAKYNVKLIGSILPGDIDIERVSQDGPKLLRKYIEFAMHTETAGENGNENQELDSPFEKSVYDFLVSQGYSVAKKVGCSAYRIDVAVRHPQKEGVFVLGIECDGHTYVSSRTARERDRLRREVLEKMGWKLYRVWSPDWIKDNAGEKKRLLRALENAIQNYGKDDKNTDVNSEIVEPENEEVENEGNPDEQECFDDTPLFSVEEKQNNVNSYGIVPYVELDVSKYKKPIQLAHVKSMILLEQPVHFDIICERLSAITAPGQTRADVQRRVNSLILGTRDVFFSHDDYYYSMQFKTKGMKLQVRTVGNRTIKYLPPEEICAGLIMVAEKCIGLTEEELLTETEHAFGFRRITANINGKFASCLELLKKNKRIYIQDGKVFVKK